MLISWWNAVLLALFGLAGLLTSADTGLCQEATRATQETEMAVAVYGIADLVIPANAPAKVCSTRERELIESICNSIDPASWEDAGGEAAILYYPLGYGLVVRQTAENLEKIAKLLDSMRCPKNAQTCAAPVTPIHRCKSTSENTEQMIAKTYEVADLIIPIQGTGEGEHVTTKDLMALIRSIIDPTSWKGMGGDATMSFSPKTSSLVIRQSAANHENVAALLTGLRHLQDVEVAVEIKVVTTSHLAEHFLTVGGFQKTPGEDSGTACEVAFLNDRQVASWLNAFEGHRSTQVLQAPKTTTFNGQSVCINLGDELYFLEKVNVVQINGQTVYQPVQIPHEFGLRSNLNAVVSADRRFVRLHLDFTESHLVEASVTLIPDKNAPGILLQKPNIQTLKLDKVFMVPTGGTAVFHVGKYHQESLTEFGPPVLSKIPYLDRLFTNVGYGCETQDCFLFVTARVVVNEDAVPPKP
jgi:hypothetical protein